MVVCSLVVSSHKEYHCPQFFYSILVWEHSIFFHVITLSFNIWVWVSLNICLNNHYRKPNISSFKTLTFPASGLYRFQLRDPDVCSSNSLLPLQFRELEVSSFVISTISATGFSRFQLQVKVSRGNKPFAVVRRFE